MLACILTISIAVNAQAVTIPFSQITSNGTENSEDQLFVDVLDAGAQVLFKVRNEAGINSLDSSISEVYWDDDLALLNNGPVIDPLNTSGIVDLSNTPASPMNLPSGRTISFMADYSAGRDQGEINGVHPGEMAGFLFDGNTDLVIAAINSGDFRLGMHVISIGEGANSESFVNIPEPTAMTLGALGLLLLGLGSRRERAQV